MNKKRLLSAVLVLCMILSLVPVYAAEVLPPVYNHNPAVTWYGGQLTGSAQKLYSALTDFTKEEGFSSGTASIDLVAGHYITQSELVEYAGGNPALAKAFQDARDAFFQDRPEFFYVDSTKLTLRVGSTSANTYAAYINNGPNESYLDTHFTASTVTTAISEVKSIKDNMVADIRSAQNGVGPNAGALSVSQIVTLVHNELVTRLSYTYPSDAPSTFVTGVYALQTGKANCVGYSSAMRWILSELNIPCVQVSGTAQNSQGVLESHMWNYVLADGQWYAVDTTWDDPIPETKANDIRKTYLLQGSDLMNRNHFPMAVFSPGGMTFSYPILNSLSYEEYLSSAMGDSEGDIKISVQRPEGVTDTSLYYINYKNLSIEKLKEQGLYLASRFAYKTGDVQEAFNPWVDMASYSLSMDETRTSLLVGIARAGSIQFCITDRPMEDNRLCYREDLSLSGNHIAISKALQVPYYSDYVTPPFIRTSDPQLGRNILPQKTHFRVEYDAELVREDSAIQERFEITSTYDLESTYDNLKISYGKFKTPDGKEHTSTFLDFDFTPENSYQAYSNKYSLQPVNLISAETGKAPNPIPIYVTFAMSVPCPSFVARNGGIADAFVIANPTLVVDDNADIFQYNGSLKANAMDIRLVASIPNKKEEEAMLGATPDSDNVLASAVYDLSLSCKNHLVQLNSNADYNVTIALPYPDGFNYAKNPNVTYKAYHYIKQADGSYKTEELVCRITERGLEVLANQFSPFSVVAVPNTEETTPTSKFVSVVLKTAGGTVNAMINGTTISAAGLHVVVQDESKVFSIIPESGYVIDKVLLNGVAQSGTELTFSFDSMMGDNTLEVFFIAQSVQVVEQARNFIAIAPKFEPLVLDMLTVDLDKNGDSVVLKAQSNSASSHQFYFKTTHINDLGNKPIFADSLPQEGWTLYSKDVTLPYNTELGLFVQVVQVNTSNEIVAWGQTNAAASPVPTPPPLPTPTLTPSPAPTLTPSPAPTLTPSPAPTLTPSPAPTLTPSPAPTLTPSPAPTPTPSPAPTPTPSPAPTLTPSPAPTQAPTDSDDSDKPYRPQSTPTPTIKPTTMPETPTVSISGDRAQIRVLTTAVNGTALITFTEEEINSALSQLEDAGIKNGTVVIRVFAKNADNLLIDLPLSVQNALLRTGISSFVIESDLIHVSLDYAAMQSISTSAGKAVTLSIQSVDSKASAVASRPAFELSITYGNGKTVSDFGRGMVTITMPYSLTTGERTAQICGVYVDEKGTLHWIPLSCYDTHSKSLKLMTSHFSTYAVGLHSDSSFTDIAGHWAEEGITYTAARGLVSGTGNGQFSPSMTVTRGMFVTLIGRLANVDTNNYLGSSFNDVASGSYYAPYVEWAMRQGIVNGVGNGTFAPDRPVTRQELAVIMSGFVAAMNTTQKNIQNTSVYADATEIASWAVKAVYQMQAMNLLNGKSGNRFDPNGTATRAEAAVLLQRYIEQRIG